MLNQEFDKIFVSYGQDRYISLIFFNEQDSSALLFDGINFYNKNKINISPNFQDIKYNSHSIDLKIKIIGIKQSNDIYFILLDNGDIFQIYFMMDDEMNKQIISIFDDEQKNIITPLGISSYDAAFKRFNEAVDVEILNDENSLF